MLLHLIVRRSLKMARRKNLRMKLINLWNSTTRRRLTRTTSSHQNMLPSSRRRRMRRLRSKRTRHHSFRRSSPNLNKRKSLESELLAASSSMLPRMMSLSKVSLKSSQRTATTGSGSLLKIRLTWPARSPSSTSESWRAKRTRNTWRLTLTQNGRSTISTMTNRSM